MCKFARIKCSEIFNFDLDYIVFARQVFNGPQGLSIHVNGLFPIQTLDKQIYIHKTISIRTTIYHNRKNRKEKLVTQIIQLF